MVYVSSTQREVFFPEGIAKRGLEAGPVFAPRGLLFESVGSSPLGEAFGRVLQSWMEAEVSAQYRASVKPAFLWHFERSEPCHFGICVLDSCLEAMLS